MIAYNKFSLELNRYANRLDSFANEFGAIISRQLEEEVRNGFFRRHNIKNERDDGGVLTLFLKSMSPPWWT